jgi:hypothetical protein
MRRLLFARAIFATMTGMLVGAGFAESQDARRVRSAAATRRVEPASFGTSSQTLRSIGYADFVPSNSSVTWNIATGIYTTGVSEPFRATPHLPSGVLLTYLELDYCDTDPVFNVTLGLFECDFDGTNCVFLQQIVSGDGGSGCNYLGIDLTPLNHVIDNFDRRLLMTAVTGSNTSGNQLVGAYIGYKLQVSPAPAGATFADVPTAHPYHRFVEALVASGITAGCGGGNYCVDSPITRGEMAVFLAAALGLHFPN